MMQDLQGPKIRIGTLAGGGPVTPRWRNLPHHHGRVEGTAERVSTTYRHLPDDVIPATGSCSMTGSIELRVTGIEGTDVMTTVVHGGPLGEHKGINLPGVNVSSPALTEKDLADLAFGVALGVDYVALSFVRAPQDVRLARAALKRLHARRR